MSMPAGKLAPLTYFRVGHTADDRFPTRPKGATQMIQYSVAALEKDLAILCGLRLVLDHLGSSEHGNITLKEY